TAVNYNIPVIWLVLNNGRLGTVYSMQKSQYQGRYISSTFKRLDIVKIAEGLGAQAVQIEKPGELKEIMPRLIESKKPTVINAIIDPEEMPSMDLF
ncbi:acetolactate synthase large subunit, partial [bacterium]|nr:acetolactate synthase large subunit [bacterium]